MLTESQLSDVLDRYFVKDLDEESFLKIIVKDRKERLTNPKLKKTEKLIYQNILTAAKKRLTEIIVTKKKLKFLEEL